MAKCILCGSNDSKILIKSGYDYEYRIPFSADVVQCTECKFVFQYPKPDIKTLPHYYPENYANYAEPNNIITRTLVKIKEYLDAKQVIKLIGIKGKILDVGCGDCHFFNNIKKYGQWECIGTDISKDAAKVSEKYGYKIYIGELENLNIPKNSISLIRLNHILEHVINPITTLKIAFEILEPGGFLIGETPNISCPDFYILKRYWGALHLPRHIHFFKRNTLIRIFNESGFMLKKLKYTLMTTGWALGVQNYFQSKKKNNDNLKNGRISVYPVLLLIFLPILIIQMLFKKTTMVSFIFQKPNMK